MFAFVASALLAIGAAAPSMPNQYYVSGTITLPYGNITEPFSSYVDLVNNMQASWRLECLSCFGKACLIMVPMRCVFCVMLEYSCGK